MARVLTVEEYARLAAKLDIWSPDVIDQLRAAHRLLCEGRKIEDLTPAEQFYASAFKGAVCVQIPNDYGWEPGIEIEIEAELKAPKPKPKKEEKQ